MESKMGCLLASIFNRFWQNSSMIFLTILECFYNNLDIRKMSASENMTWYPPKNNAKFHDGPIERN